MNKKLLTAIVCFLCYWSVLAQNELGLFLGGSLYTGDLSEQLVTFKETKPAVGLFFRAPMSSHFSLRFAFNYGQIAGSDQNSDVPTRQLRNLSFQTSLLEGGVHLLFHVLGNGKVAERRKVDPYVWAGFGLVKFTPKANYEGRWVSLQPLGTEGQGTEFGKTKYGLNEWVLPVGLGLRIQTGETFSIGFEVGYRYTFTDYLDDVSTTYPDIDLVRDINGEVAAALSDRSNEVNNGENAFIAGEIRGNPDHNDAYVFAGLTLAYRLYTPGKAKYACPKW